MKRSIYAFGGMAPAIEEDRSPPDTARLARDVDVSTSGLRAPPTDFPVNTPVKLGTKRAIYKFGRTVTNDTDYWFHWLNDTDVTRGTVANDVQERTYYTEAGQPPKVTDNSLALGGPAMPFASYLLGFPSPATPTVGVTGTPDVGSTSIDSNVLITYVSGWGEEGPPCVASTQFQISPGQTLTVSAIPGPPSGAYNVVSIRIYLVATTSGGVGAAKFWKAIAIGTSSTSGTVNYATMQEELEQPYQLQPPADLFGIMAHPGKFLVGFSGNMFCRSEVNRGHGWPAQYRDPMDSDIVGGAMIGAATVICTKKNTIIGEASDPVSYGFNVLESLQQPCVSKRSICQTDNGVAYAGASGLVLVAANRTAGIVTLPKFTEAQWAAYKPESMLCAFFHGRVFAFFDTGSRQGCLEIDLARGLVTESSIYATAAFAAPHLKALYLQVGNDIVKWRAGGGRRTLFWGGPARVLDKKRAFGAARVVAAGYPLIYRHYMDEALVHTEVVNSRRSFSVSPVKGYSWRAEIEGGDGITAVEIAADRRELLEQG